MKLNLIYFFISFSLKSVFSEDFACPAGKSDNTFKVFHGDSLLYSTNPDFGTSYEPKTKCKTTYELGPDCQTGLKFSCSEFDLPNSDAKCKSGDRLIIGKKRFCGTKSPNIRQKKSLTILFVSDKNDQGGSGAFCTVKCLDNYLDLRVDERTLTEDQRSNLSLALGNIKKYPPNDWKSFENVANYHGDPQMCDKDWVSVVIPTQQPKLVGTCDCCIHGIGNGCGKYFPYFCAWHRNFMVNFAESLKSGATEDISGFIPYWDWTNRTGIPELALSGEWLNGPVKFANRTSIRGEGYVEAFDETFREQLFTKTRKAFCANNFGTFNGDKVVGKGMIQHPHDDVHLNFSPPPKFPYSDMSQIPKSSFDPIFYMHHNYIDRQYAYYQALQDLRGNPVTYSDEENPEMPPFSGLKKSNIPPNMDIPNPINKTRDNSRPRMGLDFTKAFGYKYDSLLFDGKTPEEFHHDYQAQCFDKKIVGFNSDGVPSINKIYIVDQGISESVGLYSLFAPSSSNFLTELDVTPAFDKHGLDYDDRNLHFEIKSFDLEGNELKSPYKPTSEYINVKGERIIRYHTSYFGEYNPKVIIGHLRATIEFVNDDGNLSNEVNVIVDQNNQVKPVNGSIELTSTKHQFLYGGHMIEAGFGLGTYVKCNKKGLPVKVDQDPHVNLVPWNLKWLRENGDSFAIFYGEVAVVAWCSDTYTPSDIYEVFSYEDFQDCTNLSEHPVHFSQDYDVEGFIVRPRVGVQYFVSKSKCKAGLKVSILTNPGPGR